MDLSSEKLDKAISDLRNAQSQHGSTLNLEIVISEARDLGFEKMETIKLLMDGLDLSFPDSKRMVHESSVWEDRKEIDNRLHDQVFSYLNRRIIE